MRFSSGCKALSLMALLCFGLGFSGDAVAQTQQFGVEETAPERVPDVARGEQLFRQCRVCHETAPGQVKIGPSLAGIVGRRPGSVPAFGYSQDMINYGASGTIWNPQNLDLFLTRPRSLIAGTKMVFQGFRKPWDREDVIAYLLSLQG